MEDRVFRRFINLPALKRTRKAAIFQRRAKWEKFCFLQLVSNYLPLTIVNQIKNAEWFVHQKFSYLSKLKHKDAMRSMSLSAVLCLYVVISKRSWIESSSSVELSKFEVNYSQKQFHRTPCTRRPALNVSNFWHIAAVSQENYLC